MGFLSEGGLLGGDPENRGGYGTSNNTSTGSGGARSGGFSGSASGGFGGSGSARGGISGGFNGGISGSASTGFGGGGNQQYGGAGLSGRASGGFGGFGSAQGSLGGFGGGLGGNAGSGFGGSAGGVGGIGGNYSFNGNAGGGFGGYGGAFGSLGPRGPGGSIAPQSNASGIGGYNPAMQQARGPGAAMGLGGPYGWNGPSGDPTNMTPQQMADSADRLYGFPPGTMRALIGYESMRTWNPKQTNPYSSALGLTQMLRGTAKQMGVTDYNDPMQQIYGGAKYLNQQIQDTGSVRAGLGSYYAGPGNFQQQGFGFRGNYRGAPTAGQYADRIMADTNHMAAPVNMQGSAQPIPQSQQQMAGNLQGNTATDTLTGNLYGALPGPVMPYMSRAFNRPGADYIASIEPAAAPPTAQPPSQQQPGILAQGESLYNQYVAPKVAQGKQLAQQAWDNLNNPVLGLLAMTGPYAKPLEPGGKGYGTMERPTSQPAKKAAPKRDNPPPPVQVAPWPQLAFQTAPYTMWQG